MSMQACLTIPAPPSNHTGDAYFHLHLISFSQHISVEDFGDGMRMLRGRVGGVGNEHCGGCSGIRGEQR